MAIDLKIRDIRTGQAQVAQFENIDDAETWLRERPRFIDVLGPPRHGAIPAAEEARLREAMRPLDEEEKAARAEQDDRDAAAMRDALAKEQARIAEQMEQQRQEQQNADPNRIMQVGWDQHKGFFNADPGDVRQLPAVVKTAFEAWIAERNEWVHSRGQYVVDATVSAWPGPIPSGNEDDRIEPGGRFNVLAGSPPS